MYCIQIENNIFSLPHLGGVVVVEGGVKEDFSISMKDKRVMPLQNCAATSKSVTLYANAP